jgi:hypothetical protein
MTRRDSLNRPAPRHRKAVAEYNRLMAISMDTAQSHYPAFSDGNLALEQAMHIHREAR